MSCVYTPNTDFSVKDALPPGDPQKRILGSDFDAEFNDIATTLDCKLDAADGTATGTTTFETITTENLTVSGTTTLNTTTTIGGSNLQDQLDALATNSGAATNVTPSRYWRFKLTTSTTISVRELLFWTNGSSFTNGLRYSPGILLDNAALAPTITTGPDNSGGTIGNGANHVDGS